MAAQLELVQPDEDSGPRWSLDGCQCSRCSDGRMYLVHPSDPCGCQEVTCICLAEGYARCDSCGALQQVFPREMIVSWVTRDGN